MELKNSLVGLFVESFAEKRFLCSCWNADIFCFFAILSLVIQVDPHYPQGLGSWNTCLYQIMCEIKLCRFWDPLRSKWDRSYHEACACSFQGIQNSLQRSLKGSSSFQLKTRSAVLGPLDVFLRPVEAVQAPWAWLQSPAEASDWAESESVWDQRTCIEPNLQINRLNRYIGVINILSTFPNLDPSSSVQGYPKWQWDLIPEKGINVPLY